MAMADVAWRQRGSEWAIRGDRERLVAWLALHEAGWWSPARGWQGVSRHANVSAALRAEGGDLNAASALVLRLHGAHTLVASFFDDDYPGRLRDLSELHPSVGAPLLLHVRGRLPQGPAVALVGSRRADSYGLRLARAFGREMAAAGVAVISGLARGVDRAAHEGALEGGGPTVAVLGSGVFHVYPPEHAGLADSIAEQGAVVSEFPPSFHPRARTFPLRNRVIAALADLVVVVQASEKSGTLGTVSHAMALQRLVAATPGDVDRSLSRGTNALLRDGAQIVCSASDVLGLLDLTARASGRENASLGDTRADSGRLPERVDVRVVWEALKLRERNLDHLMDETGLTLPRLLSALTELELLGWVARTGDGFARAEESSGQVL